LEVGSPILIYISMVVFFVVIVSLVDSPEKIRRSLLIANVSMAFASWYIIREFQQYHASFVLFRPSGKIVGDSNYFSMAAMLALPVGYFYFAAERSPFYRLAVLFCVVFISFAFRFFVFL